MADHPKVHKRRRKRHAHLRGQGYQDYADYLRSPHWARVRLAYWDRAVVGDELLPADCLCGETEDLQLHHKTYERVGHEKLTDLRPLCDDCHRLVHVLERRGDLTIDLQGFENGMRAFLYRVQNMELQERAAAEAPMDRTEAAKIRSAERWRNKREQKRTPPTAPLPLSRTMSLGDQVDALLAVARAAGCNAEADAEVERIRRRMAALKNMVNQRVKARRRAA